MQLSVFVMVLLIVSDVGFAFRIDKLPRGALADCVFVLRFTLAYQICTAFALKNTSSKSGRAAPASRAE